MFNSIFFVLCLFLPLVSSAQIDHKYGKNLCENYSKEELEYFAEIAFGNEFTSNNMVDQLKDNSNTFSKRWYEDVKIKVSGTPSESDIQVLNQVVRELNELIDPIELSIVAEDKDFNTEIKFGYHERKAKVIAGDVEYEVTYRGSETGPTVYLGKITNSMIFISDTKVSPKFRAHVIREELTQSLGLFRDSDKYANSIFNDTRNREVTEYSDIDVKLIEILYNYDLPRYLKKERFLEAVSDCLD